MRAAIPSERGPSAAIQRRSTVGVGRLTVEPLPPAASLEPSRPARQRLLPFGLAAVPVVLVVVWALSHKARGFQTTGWFAEPPIYGLLVPMWSGRDVLGMAAVAGFALLAAVLVRVDRVSSRTFVVALLLGALAMAFAVNFGRGLSHVTSPLCTAAEPGYRDRPPPAPRAGRPPLRHRVPGTGRIDPVRAHEDSSAWLAPV